MTKKVAKQARKKAEAAQAALKHRARKPAAPRKAAAGGKLRVRPKPIPPKRTAPPKPKASSRPAPKRPPRRAPVSKPLPVADANLQRPAAATTAAVIERPDSVPARPDSMRDEVEQGARE